MSKLYPSFFVTTIRLQPVVLLYSSVSICSKLASSFLPTWEGDYKTFIFACIFNPHLTAIVFLMFILLAIYAIVWQIIIKKAHIAVIYANKSSYLLWTQLAAISLFGETISLSNITGIALIFTGILLGNIDINETN